MPTLAQIKKKADRLAEQLYRQNQLYNSTHDLACEIANDLEVLQDETLRELHQTIKDLKVTANEFGRAS